MSPAASGSVSVSHWFSGGGYGGVLPFVLVTVEDDDGTGVTISKSGVTVAEADDPATPGDDREATYTVVLDAAPSGAVTVTPASDDPDGTARVSGALTFTTADWSTPRTVTVTGIDGTALGERNAVVSHAVSGPGAAGLAAGAVTVTVTGAGVAGVTVSPAALAVAEGRLATWTVALDARPTGSVTVMPSGSPAEAATLEPTSLAFTRDDWRTPRTVTVTAGRDRVAGDRVVEVAHAAYGGGYAGVAASPVTLTVTDADAGVTVSAPALTVAENAGAATYAVALDAAPTGPVTVTPAARGADGTGPTAAVTVSGALTFTTGDWAVARTVTVTGVPDGAFGDRRATVTHTAAGGGYDGVWVREVAVTVRDDAGVTVSESALTIAENGAGTYAVVLDAAPSGPVTVTPAARGADGTGSTGAMTVSGALTFTTGDWATAQTVTVTGVFDEASGDRRASVVHTIAGGGYAGVPVAGVSVTVANFGLVLSDASRTVAEADDPATPGDERTATWTVRLRAPPAGDVTVAVASADPAVAEAGPPSLTFTRANWATAQTVTVTGVGDGVPLVDRSVEVVHTRLRGRPRGCGRGAGVGDGDRQRRSRHDVRPRPVVGQSVRDLHGRPRREAHVGRDGDGDGGACRQGRSCSGGESVGADLHAGRLGHAADGDREGHDRRRAPPGINWVFTCSPTPPPAVATAPPRESCRCGEGHKHKHYSRTLSRRTG